MTETFYFGLGLISASVILKVMAQVGLKARLNFHGPIPFNIFDFYKYFLASVSDLAMVASVAMLVGGGLLWFAALSRLPLSYAFPISAASYPLILFASAIFLKELVTSRMIAGNLLILGGIVIVGLGR